MRISPSWLCCIVLGPLCHYLQADKLRIFIVDRVDTPPMVLYDAIKHSARLLADAGVKTSWKLCPASSLLPGSRPCVEAGPLALTLRVLPSHEAKALTGRGNWCGVALSGAAGEYGSSAIVDGGCIAGKSVGMPAEFGIAILAHVFAHELAHLLLGRDSHSTGLMRAEWTTAERTLLFRGQLAFTERDAARLREAVSERALAANGRFPGAPPVSRGGSNVRPD
jgi:hypothetical protein